MQQHKDHHVTGCHEHARRQPIPRGRFLIIEQPIAQKGCKQPCHYQGDNRSIANMAAQPRQQKNTAQAAQNTGQYPRRSPKEQTSQQRRHILDIVHVTPDRPGKCHRTNGHYTKQQPQKHLPTPVTSADLPSFFHPIAGK